jgi:hypothetical protein
LQFGSEAWVLKKREEQRSEAAQMTFLRHLLGITKLDKERIKVLGEKTGAENIVKEIKQHQKKWLQHVQMDTNRHLLGITKLDKEKNQCSREKTGAQNIVKEIKQYQKKWLQHVQMDTNRIPKQALKYRPRERRNIGRPRKRWRDQLHLED